MRAISLVLPTFALPFKVFLLPFAVFFPGLLCDTTIVAENIAYPLYGLILAAAIPGWKRNKWLWFYAAVIAASIVKVPMLLGSPYIEEGKPPTRRVSPGCDRERASRPPERSVGVRGSRSRTRADR